MTEHKGACCSSPAAMCYWFAASRTAWGVLSPSAATILFAMAIGCVATTGLGIALFTVLSPGHYS